MADVLVIAFCAIICGAQIYEDLEYFGNVRKLWFSCLLDMKNGILSADTFQRIFEILDPQNVAKCLRRILRSEDVLGKIIAFDGKTIRGSKSYEHRAFHVLSAFLTDDQIVIGEEIVDEKTNEITAIPELLGEINVKAATITIDAMGTQTKIAAKIVEKEADYAVWNVLCKTALECLKRSNFGSEKSSIRSRRWLAGSDVQLLISVLNSFA